MEPLRKIRTSGGRVNRSSRDQVDPPVPIVLAWVSGGRRIRTMLNYYQRSSEREARYFMSSEEHTTGDCLGC